MHVLQSQLPRRTAAALLVFALSLPAIASEPRGELLNDWEIYNEIKLDAAAAASAKDHLMAFLDYRKGNSAGAQKDLDAALAIAPDMAEAWYEKGEIYAATGKVDLARQSYNKALQIRSSYSDAILGLKRLEAKASP